MTREQTEAHLALCGWRPVAWSASITNVNVTLVVFAHPTRGAWLHIAGVGSVLPIHDGALAHVARQPELPWEQVPSGDLKAVFAKLKELGLC